jgi:DNA-binding CsgD family transcriptional regulator/PAS domain-containing protein
VRRTRVSDVDAVVGRIYDAALDPKLWTTVLDEIAGAVGAGSAALFGAPVCQNMGLYHSPAGNAFFDWLAREGGEVHNPRPERAMRLGRPGRAITESHLFSDWELAHIPFNVEMTRHGFHREAGGMFAAIDGAPLFFTCQRPFGEERFGSAELGMIEAFFPHIERAAQIAARFFRERTEGMLEAFEHMSCGGILLGPDGRVVRLNRSAHALLGVCVDVTGNRLSALDAKADDELQRLLKSVAGGSLRLSRTPVSAFVPLPRPAGRPLTVYAMPLGGENPDLFQRARALLVIVDPDANRDVRSELLAQAYRLTPAELRVALALAKGRDVKEIAELHGVSLNTVRGQLKSLMGKTDTHRQSELVALLIKASFSPMPGGKK